MRLRREGHALVPPTLDAELQDDILPEIPAPDLDEHWVSDIASRFAEEPTPISMGVHEQEPTKNVPMVSRSSSVKHKAASATSATRPRPTSSQALELSIGRSSRWSTDSDLRLVLAHRKKQVLKVPFVNEQLAHTRTGPATLFPCLAHLRDPTAASA